jgi:hypothetical protein
MRIYTYQWHRNPYEYVQYSKAACFYTIAITHFLLVN